MILIIASFLGYVVVRTWNDPWLPVEVVSGPIKRPVEASVPLEETIRQKPTEIVVTFMATVVEDPTPVGETDMVEVFVGGDKQDGRAILNRVLAPRSANLHAGDRVIVEVVEFVQNYMTTPDRPAIARKVGPDYVVENKE